MKGKEGEKEKLVRVCVCEQSAVLYSESHADDGKA